MSHLSLSPNTFGTRLSPPAHLCVLYSRTSSTALYPLPSLTIDSLNIMLTWVLPRAFHTYMALLIPIVIDIIWCCSMLSTFLLCLRCNATIYIFLQLDKEFTASITEQTLPFFMAVFLKYTHGMSIGKCPFVTKYPHYDSSSRPRSITWDSSKDKDTKATCNRNHIVPSRVSSSVCSSIHGCMNGCTPGHVIYGSESYCLYCLYMEWLWIQSLLNYFTPKKWSNDLLIKLFHKDIFV